MALMLPSLSNAKENTPTANLENKLPIEVTADRLVSQDKKGISVYTGNVVIIQGSSEIKGDKVTLHHPNRKMSHAVIDGAPAKFKRFIPDEQKWVNGHAKTITYDSANNKVILEGDAFVNQEGQNSISGPKIIYNTLDKTLQATGNKNKHQRVKMIFTPDEKEKP